MTQIPSDSPAARVAREMGIDAERIRRRWEFLEFTDEDRARLRALYEGIRHVREPFIENFYAYVLRVPELARLVRDEAQLERLKRHQAAYFESLFTGPYDWDYVLHRIQVGIAHERVGLAPEWYLGAYAFYIRRLLPAIFRALGAEAGLQACQSMTKVVFFDLALALDAYFHAHRRALERMAWRDALTGLPNRHRLLREMEALLREEVPFALLLARVARLREINRLLGAEAGDRLLRQVAGALRKVIGETGMVARIGGDVFAILLPGVQADEAQRYAEQCARASRSPWEVGELHVEAPLNFGVVARDASERPVAGDLLEKAGMALHAARQDASRVRIYDASLEASARERWNLARELPRALARDELELWYQPQVTVRDAKVVGTEALARWRHPEHGIIPPDVFVSVAEEEGMTPMLTRWVLRTACAQRARWQMRGLPKDLVVAVNVSAVDLADVRLADTVRATLDAFGLQPGMLALEVTETALMVDAEAAQKVLDQLRELGVRLSIDDFGTGHASLRYLRDLPVHELKVDRSFVGAMLEDAKSHVIVRAVIALAHELGLAVVAEGVENHAILEALASLGCDRAQGYGIARPMPAPDLERWLARHGIGGFSRR